ncbi:hypothetical protein VP395_09640 [Mariniflexile soesokkakense]|uniref:Uncharacterized protein n=1 Tax=Mariniflexile soesokkakense TaxID=1343160 RepID=A0ABV0AC86_9FLAO
MRNKSPLTLYAFLFSICISLFSITETIAQENGIYELNESNSFSSDVSRSSENSNKNKKGDREHFYNLIYKQHPTSYVGNNVIKKYKDNSLVSKLTFNDTKSFNLLNQNNSEFNSIELITVVLNNPNDLNSKLDLTEISGLNSLKYILIKCYFECSKQQIKEFVNTDSNVRVFYKNEIPS